MADATQNGAHAAPESILLRDRHNRALCNGDLVVLPNASPVFTILGSQVALQPNLPPGARTVVLRCDITMTYVPGGASPDMLRIATYTDPEAAPAQAPGPKLVIP